MDSTKQKLIAIGAMFRQARLDLSYSQRDVAFMTGLTTATVGAVERGSGSTLTNFLLLCRALQMQPRMFFSDDLDLTPLYDIAPDARKRINLNRKLDQLVFDSDFFEEPRRVAEVLDALAYDRSESNKFSVYLSGYCKEGELDYIKEGGIKRYVRKKS